MKKNNSSIYIWMGLILLLLFFNYILDGVQASMIERIDDKNQEKTLIKYNWIDEEKKEYLVLNCSGQTVITTYTEDTEVKVVSYVPYGNCTFEVIK